MRKLLLGTIMAATVGAVPAAATEFEGLELRVVKEFTLSGPNKAVSPQTALSPSVVYSNVGTFQNSGFPNGDAALQGINTITRLTADDLTPTGGGQDVIAFKFSVVNFNATAVTFRPRVRFWFADGAAGAPDTYYNVPGQVGFSFNPITMNPQTVVVLTAPLAAGLLTMPTSTFWAGVTFDNNNNTTGATAAMLNNLGQGLYGPPTVGSSADQFFLTTGAGSFFPTANPAGTLNNLGGSPAANFGWEFTLDSPIAVEETAWSQVKAMYR
jgi:hypothetical protein